MKTIKFAVLAALALGASSAAHAQFFATGATDGTGTQPWVLGHQFTVNSTITVTDLGAFDSGGDGIVGNITVTLWNVGGGQLASSVAHGIGSTSGYHYDAISHVTLTPGTYVLTAFGFDGVNDFHGDSANSDTLPSYSGASPAVTYNFDYVGTVAGNVNPSISGNGAAISSRFKAASFAFTPAVPEPETYAMVAGLGLVGFGLWRRRQAK